MDIPAMTTDPKKLVEELRADPDAYTPRTAVTLLIGIIEAQQAALSGIVRLIDIIHAENADKGHILPDGPTVTACRTLAGLSTENTNAN